MEEEVCARCRRPFRTGELFAWAPWLGSLLGEESAEEGFVCSHCETGIEAMQDQWQAATQDPDGATIPEDAFAELVRLRGP